MLKNAYLLAKIGADTAENEQHFAEILPIGRRGADRCPGRRHDGRSAKFRKIFARFRLYWHRSLQVNTRFSKSTRFSSYNF